MSSFTYEELRKMEAGSIKVGRQVIVKVLVRTEYWNSSQSNCFIHDRAQPPNRIYVYRIDGIQRDFHSARACLNALMKPKGNGSRAFSIEDIHDKGNETDENDDL